MELTKFLVLYHNGSWRDGGGVDFTTLGEDTLQTICSEYMLCVKDKAYLDVKVSDAKNKGIISIDTFVE